MPRVVRGLVRALLVATAIAPASSESFPEILTLDQAIAIAFDGNRQLAIAEYEVRKAEERVAVRKTGYYPVTKLDIQGSKLLSDIVFEFEPGIFGTFPIIGPIPATDTQVATPTNCEWVGTAAIAQPLSQLYRVGLGVQYAKLDLDVKAGQLRLGRLALASRVRESYYAVLQAESARTAAEESSQYLLELER